MRPSMNLLFLTVFFLLLKRSNVFKKLLYWYRIHRMKLVEQVQCIPQLDRVKHAFLRNYLEGREKGSQVTLFIDGKCVLDIKAGKDEHSVFEDLTMVFSSTKVIESLVVAILVDHHKLAYEESVATYWPEFGKRFSSKITVADVMKHRAGLEQIYRTLTTEEAGDIFGSIEKEEQFVFRALSMDEDVKRGEKRGRYHAITRGILVDILCFKVDGRRGRQFIDEEIVAKIEGVDFYLGCPEDKQDRMAICEPSQSLLSTGLELLMHKIGIVNAFYHPGPLATEHEVERHYHEFLEPEEVALTTSLLNRNGMVFKTLMLVNDQGLGAYHLANSRGFRSLPLMSVTGATNSRSLARILVEVACDGGKLLSAEGLKKALEHDGPLMDDILGKPFTFTNAGWCSNQLGSDWFGWGGAGGSVTAFSPRLRASFSYIPTRLEARAYNPNGMRILNELTRAMRESNPYICINEVTVVNS